LIPLAHVGQAVVEASASQVMVYSRTLVPTPVVSLSRILTPTASVVLLLVKVSR